MSMEYWVYGRLEFRDATAVGDAKNALTEEGYEGHEDNVLSDDDVTWSGTTLTVAARGSMPYSCFDISTSVLQTFAQYASQGEIVALNVEDGCGERYLAGNGDPAGGEVIELEADEIDRLRREYGWGVE